MAESLADSDREAVSAPKRRIKHPVRHQKEKIKIEPGGRMGRVSETYRPTLTKKDPAKRGWSLQCTQREKPCQMKKLSLGETLFRLKKESEAMSVGKGRGVGFR